MIRVACAIVFFGDQILVTQRSAVMKLPLKWEFPGGKVEKGENDMACIKREIREELNIEIEVVDKLSESTYDYGTFAIRLIPFVAHYVSGDIQLAEHCNYQLLPKKDLASLDWAEADISVVAELLRLSY